MDTQIRSRRILSFGFNPQTDPFIISWCIQSADGRGLPAGDCLSPSRLEARACFVAATYLWRALGQEVPQFVPSATSYGFGVPAPGRNRQLMLETYARSVQSYLRLHGAQRPEIYEQYVAA